MSEYSLRTRQVRLDGDWDVVVAGGGPAGCTAAVAAAREGAKTLLLEATGCLGGMGTAGLVPAWCPFSDGDRMIYRGLAEHVFDAARQGVPHEPPDRLDWVAINPEHLKRVYDRLVTDAGVTVRFFTTITAAEMAGNGDVDVILSAGKAGLGACKGRVYVDCTGDGDVAAWAGARSERGDEETGEQQPATHCFVLSNVNSFNYTHGRKLYGATADGLIWDILASGEYPLIPDEHMCQNLIGPDAVGFNAGHLWDVDPSDPANLSQAMIHGRRLADEIRRALAEQHPAAFGGAYLAATAALMGIRETRRVIGDYMLNLTDYLARRSFPDEIARNAYPIDIHTRKDEVEKVRREGKQTVAGRFEDYEKGESHGIPYRCLTPCGLRNVLVAGRCISTDHTVQASTRVMPVCLATGEAAGLAAALAAQQTEPDVHAVDTDQLRARLRREGAYLP